MHPPNTAQEHPKKDTGDGERVGSLEIGGMSLVSILLSHRALEFNSLATDQRWRSRTRRSSLDSCPPRLRQPSPSQPPTHSAHSFRRFYRSVRQSCKSCRIILICHRALFVAIGKGVQSGPLCLLLAFIFWVTVVFSVAQCRKPLPYHITKFIP